MPLYNTDIAFLREMLDSVVRQTYPNWQLCLADGSDRDQAEIEAVVAQYQKDNQRILYRVLEENRGISENTNACAQMATGDFLALLDHDDILAPNAPVSYTHLDVYKRQVCDSALTGSNRIL